MDDPALQFGSEVEGEFRDSKVELVNVERAMEIGLVDIALLDLKSMQCSKSNEGAEGGVLESWRERIVVILILHLPVPHCHQSQLMVEYLTIRPVHCSVNKLRSKDPSMLRASGTLLQLTTSMNP